LIVVLVRRRLVEYPNHLCRRSQLNAEKEQKVEEVVEAATERKATVKTADDDELAAMMGIVGR